jgi:5'-nucleotidase
MEILVTNDDGIFAPGLWKLVTELKQIARVSVIAPDREQSGFGTAVTLRHPLRVQQVRPLVPDVEAFSVEGTPTDCVILAVEKLLTRRVDLIVSGINSGPNVGDDVLISGTVAAALTGYLHGFPALAISVESLDHHFLDTAARLAALLAKPIISQSPGNVLLNVNLPALPLAKTRGLKVTHLARKSHLDTVEEGHDGRKSYYWLVRQKIQQNAEKETDIWAVESGYISITNLHVELLSQTAPLLTEVSCGDILGELRETVNEEA